VVNWVTVLPNFVNKLFIVVSQLMVKIPHLSLPEAEFEEESPTCEKISLISQLVPRKGKPNLLRK
jgi:hypothetical protein